MMSKVWVYSGSRPSNGAKELAACDGFLRLRQERFFKVKPNDVVINWGVTDFKPTVTMNKVLNKPGAIALATNKLHAFQRFATEGVSIVPWTTDVAEASKWSVVVCRHKLSGHSGEGIEIVEPAGQTVPTNCPLFTKYINKEREYRVHVVLGKVIDTAKKIKDPDRDVVTWKVRSHANGFIFARNNVQPSEVRDALAVAAISALGLDFGAVDIIEDKKGNFYVLEVNTAPGLEGQTITNYSEAFLGTESGA